MAVSLLYAVTNDPQRVCEESRNSMQQQLNGWWPCEGLVGEKLGAYHRCNNRSSSYIICAKGQLQDVA